MRKLATFGAAFSAGVFAWRYGLWPLAVLAALFCLAGLLLAGKSADPKKRRARLGLILAGLMLALGWSGAYAHLTLSPWEELHKQKDVLLDVEVQGYPTPAKWSQNVVPAKLKNPATGAAVSGLAYFPGEVDLLPGDSLRVRGNVQLADRVGEEELTYFSAKGLYLRVYVDEGQESRRPDHLPLRHWPAAFAQALGQSLDNLLGEEMGGLAKALVTGDQSGLSGHFVAMGRRAGLAHVIVISGMHMGFLAGAMALLMRKNSRIGAVLTLLLLVFFALAAGGSPSAWRAVFFCGAGLLAPLVGRENDPPTSLLTALMLLLLVNPFSAASVSLQLSFAAVAGIQLLTPGLLKRLTPKRPKGAGWPRRLWWSLRAILAANLALSLGAILFTTPLSAFYFGMVSLLGPLSNLLAFWAVSLAFMGCALLGVVGLAFPGVAGAAAVVLHPVLGYLLWLTPALGRLPFAAITMTSDYYAWGCFFLYAILCLNLFWPGEGKKRPWVPAGCALVLAVACVAFTRLEFTLADLTVAVLDVGQGQSVVISIGGRTILVDCGGTGSKDPGDVAADYLSDMGITTLDLLVLTHYHSDHANGVPELMERMEVQAVALPDVEPDDRLRKKILAEAETEGAEVTWVTSNMEYPLGEEGTLTLYAPLGEGSTNELGLTVLATAGDYDVLVTGDMNADVERRLVKYGNLPDIELLVAGHHGSKYSTCTELLEATRPETAIISVGRNNSYGHPADETMNRLQEVGVTIYRTDLSGTVSIHNKNRK